VADISEQSAVARLNGAAEQPPGGHSPRRISASIFTALRHHNFRLFWFGQIISVTGTWMQSLGQAWLVLQLTHNAFLLGLVSALQFLPVLILSVFGGVIADKLPKRSLLIGTQTAAMLQAFILFALAATGVVQVWHIMLLALCLGTVNALDIPTRQAFISEMVERDDLMNAISLNSAQFNASRVIGPGVAGVLIVALGIPPLFLLNAISYLAVIAGLALMDTSLLHAPVAPSRREAPLRQIREGVVFAWRTPIIRLALLMLFVISTFGMNFNVILPLLAANVYHNGARGYGIMSSLMGAGSLAAALVLAGAVKRPRVGLLVASAAGFSLIEIVLSRAPFAYLAFGLLVLVGFSTIFVTATSNTLLQTNSPDHMRGRVMSLFAMVFAGATPFGALLAGTVAHNFGAQTALLVGALPCAAIAVYGWLARRSATRAPALVTSSALAPRGTATALNGSGASSPSLHRAPGQPALQSRAADHD
jgi:MFS family permease